MTASTLSGPTTIEITGDIPFDIILRGPKAVEAGRRLADRPHIIDRIGELIAGAMLEQDPESDPAEEPLIAAVTAAGDSVGEADAAPVRVAHIVPECAFLPITSGGHVIPAERLQRAYAAGRAAVPVLSLDKDIVPPTPPLRNGSMNQNRIYVVLRGIDGEKGLFGQWSSTISPSGVTRDGASSLVMRSGVLDSTCVFHGWPSLPEAQDYILGSGCQGMVPDRR
jgi:hypothetical protein